MVDIIPMVKPITKYAWRKVADDYTRELMEDMIEQCLSRRQGPCWLDVPLDVQAEEI